MSKQYFTFFYLLLFLPIANSNAGVVINEIMYHPSSLNSDDEYIELYNNSTTTTDISGWAFTNGIQYVFPEGASIAAGGYLILSASPASFSQSYGAESAYGPFVGRLSNDGEKIEFTRFDGSIADSFTYRDELGWPEIADGFGSSIERIHPDMAPDFADSWRASPDLGTPGKRNLSQVDAPLPIVTDIVQSPVSPRSTDTVHFRVRVFHPVPLQDVGIFYKSEIADEYQWAPMHDDGLNDDGVANDGVFGGVLPAFAHGTIVEFRVLALDANSVQGWFPFNQTAPSALYRVDNTEYDASLPLYKIVMRTQDEIMLRTRDLRSNDEISSSFLYGQSIYYQVGVRFRGKGSRYAEPKNYRVNFSTTKHFGKTRKLNLNAVNVDRQYIGLESFERLGLPAPQKQFVAVDFNGVVIPRYLEVERTGRDMMQRAFGDGNGNLYRGVEQANFDYRGEKFEPYIPNYIKETNELRRDFSDIVRLCDAFSLSSNEEFPVKISEWIDLRQWIRWFALKQILNDREGGLSRERGDDYFIYRPSDDNRFYLLPWDQDSVLALPLEAVHHHGTPAVQRLLRHPDFARFYYQELLSILDVELTPEVMQSIINETAPVNDEIQRADLMNIFMANRNAITNQIPQALTVHVDPSETSYVRLVGEEEEWRYFRGRSQPSINPMDWTEPSFDDSQWETGPGGFGYGDGDDRTELTDMEDQYTSVFIRKKFQLDDLSAITGITLTALYDDSFVAYLNGQEIVRENFDGVPFFDLEASGNHEANGYESFDASSFTSLLQPGENCLAVVGLNTNIGSSDFSLAINLYANIVNKSITKISGLTDAVYTRWVNVNGERTQYEPWLGQWSYARELEDGRHVFNIEAIDEAGLIVDSTQIVIYQNAAAPQGVTEVIGDLVWRKADSPIHVPQTVWIPPASSLTVEAGVDVRFASGAAIWAQGLLRTAPEGDEPITFFPEQNGTTWGGIVIDKVAAVVTIKNVSITGASSARIAGQNYPGVITVHEGVVDIENCSFFELNSVGIDAINSTINIHHNTFKNMGEAVHCTNSFAQVTNNYFENILGYSDAIDFDGSGAMESLIAYNTIMGSEDDGLDLGYSQTRIEGNIINGCADKGISMEGDSMPVVVNNIVTNCDIGVAVKDRCNAQVVHNTIVDVKTGVSIYEKNLGQGGAIAEVLNNVIWNTQQSVAVDEKSSLNLRSNNLAPLPGSAGSSNFSLDPMFANLDFRDFHLLENSPLIDSAEASDVSTDVYLNSRPKGNAADIGAVESEFFSAIEDWLLHIEP
ncbi:MAG: CotH kinase family protein [Candidatus Hinthialibacter antarcticus]|nr:CotH kinase family protein [Candidatus Hinthialibacter antarcticus]